MTRTIIARRELFGEPKRFADTLKTQARELLQRAGRDEPSEPAGDGSFLVTLHSHALGRDIHKQVRVHLGEYVQQGPWLRIPTRWEAVGVAQLFPAFDGGLELEEHDRGHCSVSLYGTYRPPLGPVGEIADAMGLEGQAHEATSRLLDSLARLLVDAVYDSESPAEVIDHTQLRVGQVMTKHPLTVPEDMSLRSAAQLMLLGHISGLPVTDEHGKVVGVLSEADLMDKLVIPTGFGREAMQSDRRHRSVTAGQACTRPARVTDVDSHLREAAHEMKRHKVDRLVVMDGAVLAGIVTRHDVLKALIRDDEEIEDVVVDIAEGFEESQLSVSVEMGVVKVAGEVTTRSRAGELLRSLEEVDGLIDIDAAELTWTIDDVVPPTMM